MKRLSTTLASLLFIVGSAAIADDFDIEAECDIAVEAGEETADCSCVAELAAADSDLLSNIKEAVANEAPLSEPADKKLEACR